MTNLLPRIAAAMLVLVIAIGCAHPARGQDELAAHLMRRELQRAPLSVSGREIVQVLTEIPPGVASGWHIHPGEEVGFIAAGEVEMMVAGREPVIVRAGEGFLIPPRTPHNARDIGPDTGIMVSTYIIETGQLVATFVAAPDAQPDR